MTQLEYEQKKRECWEEFKVLNSTTLETTKQAFDWIWNRAYALGKQTEAISKEEIEKAAERFADRIKISPSTHGIMVPFINGLAHDAYLQGAQDFLGKQEKDAEETLTCSKSKVNALLRWANECDGNNEEAQIAKNIIEILFGCKIAKDADTVISGWAARDDDGNLFMYSTKPERIGTMWMGEYANFDLRNYLFPDLTWESEPQTVEIIIKRKNNG